MITYISTLLFRFSKYIIIGQRTCVRFSKMSVQVTVHRPKYVRTPTEVRAYTDRCSCVHRPVYDNMEERLRIT